MKNRFQNKMILTFSMIFLVMLVLLITGAYLFLDDFYINSNKKAMINVANDFEKNIQVKGPGHPLMMNEGKAGINISILSPTFEVRGPSQAPLSPVDLSTIKMMIQSGEEEILFSVSREKMYCIKELRNSDFLVLSKPLGLAEESKRLFFQFMIRASILIYAFGILVIIYTSRRVSQPIEKINEKAQAISQLTFGEPLLIDRNDELGDLAKNINTMSIQLKKTYGALERELAEEKRLDRMRRQFVSNVSHELKNPLTMIQGYADGLTKGIAKTDETKERYYDIIFSESEKMSGIINDLLDLSAYDSGTMTLNRTEIFINLIIENCLETLDLHLKEKGIVIEKNIENVTIYCDELRINQVMTNLLSNAIKYNRAYGKIIIYTEDLGKATRILVKNTGPLMNDLQLNNIWQSFYQVDSTSKGSGLGLAIVKSIVTMHNGTVHAYVDNDMNSFEVILPKERP